METFKIFIVEDDIWYSEILKYHLLLNPDNEVEKFETGADCIKNLYKKPSLITLDYSLPDMKGDKVLKKIHEFDPELPVVIISGQEDVNTAIKLLKIGAYDYLVKDEDTKDRVWNVVKNIREKQKLQKQISDLKDEVGQKYNFTKAIKGNSEPIKHIYKMIEKATRTNITVSVTGETGTGKEMVAKAIHYNSGRKKQPFVAVNVSAIPKELIESEMFGHEKGAFTGAATRRIGKFEEAHKGTIFLDEIGEMDVNMQAKILRVLQEKEITRIGSNKPVKIDVRVVTATHRNLQEEVQNGNFRQDLYYRLLGLPIELPPLRNRDKDVLLLAKYFADEFCKENKMPKLSISSAAQEKLMKYPYPGNVRELKAVMELAVVLADEKTIQEDNITFSTSSRLQDFLVEELTLKEYEKRIINHFLEKHNNNVQLVAQKLGIGKSTLYRMIKNEEL